MNKMIMVSMLAAFATVANAGFTEGEMVTLNTSYDVAGMPQVRVFVNPGTPGANISNKKVVAMAFDFTTSGDPASFIGYCIDIRDTVLSTGLYEHTFNGVAYVPDPNWASLPALRGIKAAAYLAKAYTEVPNTGILNRENNAAVQLAVWEALYETSATYSFASGRFTANGVNAPATPALTLAGTWLNQLTTDLTTDPNFLDDVNASVFFPVDSGNQMRHQAFVASESFAVPEPSTYAMVAGVGLLGFAGWRRSRK